jgi:hypothetical protein
MANSGKSDISLSWNVNTICYCPQVTLYWATDSFFSNQTMIYSGTDNSFDHLTPDFTKTNYYRLNVCGNSSQTIAIRTGGLNYLLYPNPISASSGYTANIVFQNQYNSYYYMYLFDHNGQLIRTSNLFNGTTYQFSVDALQPGLYIFLIASPSSNIAAAGKFFVANN